MPEARHFAFPESRPEPPLPYYQGTVSPVGKPEIFLPLTFHSESRRAGHAGAGIRNTQSPDDQRYCPLEETWLPAERCTDCEYAETDSLGNVTCRGWDEIEGSSPESVLQSRMWLLMSSAEMPSSLRAGTWQFLSLSGISGSLRSGWRNLRGTWLPSLRALQRGPKKPRSRDMSFFALFLVPVAIRNSQNDWSTGSIGVFDGCGSCWSSPMHCTNASKG